MLEEKIRANLQAEFNALRDAIAGGVVLDRERYLELCGKIQGVSRALEIVQSIMRGEAHTDDDDTDDREPNS